MAESPYLHHVRQNLPRILALFNQDRTSSAYGMGDRYHWAWGLIDFANGTFQGAAHGLALLWHFGLWPYATRPDVFLQRIDALFQCTGRLTRRDGSLEEAFPFEGSYCVTALVAFDLLCAMDLLKNEADAHMRARWQAIISPMIKFLVLADETHAMISNHLATAVAALARWHALTGDKKAEYKAKALINRILQHQSEEGWFQEYQGPDPGYQTLCTYYLADAHRIRPDWDLLVPLRKSIQFLWYFAHPDGSFGGLYSSRCTRFYNPAGMEALASEIPEAHALAQFMASSVAQNKVVTLSSIDEPNLIPWFNAYCWAAVLYEQRANEEPSGPPVPCKRAEAKQTHFEQAGLLIDQGPSHYTIINTHKGGVVAHFMAGERIIEDAGVVVRSRRGVLGSTQGYSPDNLTSLDNKVLVVTSFFQAMPRRLPTPFEYLALRLLCVSLFRFRNVRELVKRILVRQLITREQSWKVKNIRTIKLGANLTIEDECPLSQGYGKVSNPGPFVSIHMASQGYWQVQDEDFGL
jgi:hypothetical protein